MIRRFSLAAAVALLLALMPLSVSARGRASGWCEQGGHMLTITGAGDTTTYAQESYPSCTVTVYDTGTANLSTIYSDDMGTALANPFTATSAGYWFFYADQSRYDVQLSDGGISTPFTLGDIGVIDADAVTASGGGGSTAWSSLTDPAANLSLSMSTYTTTFTWGNLAGTSSGLSLLDGAGSTTTGAVLNVRTTSGSTALPVQFTAQGTADGVTMDSTGALAAIGSGSITATDVSCTTCISDGEIDATGITTRSKLPSEVAYEDEANSFTMSQTFQQDIGIMGGSAFTITLTGTPTADRTVTIQDADQTLVGRSTTDTLSNKTFSDNLTWQSGTAFSGILDHAITASRTWTFPDTTGTVGLLELAQTWSAIQTFNDGTTSHDIITLDMDQPGVAGTQDSHYILWTGTSNDGSGHDADWEAFTDVTSNAGASSWTLQTRIDAAAYGIVFSVTDGGVTTFDTGVLTTYLSIGTTDPADTGALRLENAAGICWEIATPGTDECLTLDASDNFAFDNPIAVDAADPADTGSIRLANGSTQGIFFEDSPTGTDFGMWGENDHIFWGRVANKNLKLGTDENDDVDFRFGEITEASGASDPLGYFDLWVHDDMSCTTVSTYSSGHQFCFRGTKIVADGETGAFGGIHGTCGFGTNTMSNGTARCTGVQGEADFSSFSTGDPTINAFDAILTVGNLSGTNNGTVTAVYYDAQDAALDSSYTVSSVTFLDGPDMDCGNSDGNCYGFYLPNQATPAGDLRGILIQGDGTEVAAEWEDDATPSDNSSLDSPEVCYTGAFDNDGTAAVVREAETWCLQANVTSGGVAEATSQFDFLIDGGTAASILDTGEIDSTSLVASSTVQAALYASATNCADSAGAAACGSALAGAFVVDASSTSTVVSTTAVTANSRIIVQPDESLATELSVTCNTQGTLTLGYPTVSARTASTSFTVSLEVAPTTNPACFTYYIIN